MVFIDALRQNQSPKIASRITHTLLHLIDLIGKGDEVKMRWGRFERTKNATKMLRWGRFERTKMQRKCFGGVGDDRAVDPRMKRRAPPTVPAPTDEN